YFMSTTMDKTQRIIMMFLPVIFITVVARFPTGLVLYWVTTNLWTVGQGLITKRLMPKTQLPSLQRRSSRTPPKEEEESDDGAGADGDSGVQPQQSTQAKQAPPRKVRRKKRAGRR
ncbi:MAG: YidC/Oxa1 family membrane protein insertase, partial [Gaiellaceae bacterium]